MRCVNHPEAEAYDRCAGCAEAFCDSCLVDLQGEKYCGECKVMAVRGRPMAEEATIPCKEANEALIIAIIGIFFCGIILEPIAFFKALAAQKKIGEDPRLAGSGKATAAMIIGIVGFILSIVGVYILTQRRL
jgi:hypothetical protein